MFDDRNHHLIIQPDDGIQPILGTINGAELSLDIKMFQFTDPVLIQAVIQAQRRGVAVRVMLNPSRFTGEHDNDEAFALFRDAKVPVQETNPKYPITHEKSMVVDGKQAFIMSLNWAPKYFERTRDYALVTNVPEEVAEVASCFEADWQRADFTPPAVSNLIWSVGKSRQAVIDFVHDAEKSLYVQHEKYVDTPVIEALVRAKMKRGVKVHATALPVHSLREFYRLDGVAGLRLLEDLGIHVHRLKHVHLHAKLILADKKRALLSSFNIYPKCFNERRELGIKFEDRDLVKRLVEVFESDWEQSKRIDLSDEGIAKDLEKHAAKKAAAQQA
ncbi:MAG: phospholipase [Proteobacteria bacterium]|jgi:phosphatidylserine/phosphatidylglycerophosphate/cardiolipin synthase-like enzyme|nr:phospholipase [Pseudomonadota bacterium]